MFSSTGYSTNPLQSSRLLRNNDDEFFSNIHMTLSNSFRRVSINPDDSDNEDDDQTPTVERTLPIFPK